MWTLSCVIQSSKKNPKKQELGVVRKVGVENKTSLTITLEKQRKINVGNASNE
jgi:hypothetical protein